MPQYLAPGVYVEEVSSRSRPIEGVSTGTAGFVGIAAAAAGPVAVTSVVDFQRLVGSTASEYLSIAVRGFFENGGRLCYVACVSRGDSLESGLHALGRQRVSIVCCPDQHQFSDSATTIVAHCEQRRD